ncbi:hypothetical protein CLU79DRAFT_774502 [Phycomyces nitens]|nr:hypothetical protein CLU79DRAFT_774502 [Phycomyces nitens]
MYTIRCVQRSLERFVKAHYSPKSRRIIRANVLRGEGRFVTQTDLNFCRGFRNTFCDILQNTELRRWVGN